MDTRGANGFAVFCNSLPIRSAEMKLFTFLAVALLVSGCGDFSNISADVQIVGALPPAFPNHPTNTVLYRVLSPPALSGMYGTDYTSKTPRDVESRKGKIYTIDRMGKWRHLLTTTPPVGASVSTNADFFDSAKEK